MNRQLDTEYENDEELNEIMNHTDEQEYPTVVDSSNEGAPNLDSYWINDSVEPVRADVAKADSPWRLIALSPRPYPPGRVEVAWERLWCMLLSPERKEVEGNPEAEE